LLFEPYFSPVHEQKKAGNISSSSPTTYVFLCTFITQTPPIIFFFKFFFVSSFPQEIDELVDEWTPEPLNQPLSTTEQSDLAAVPIIAGPNGPKPKLVSTGKTAVNLASYNFTGLSGNEHIKQRAVDILRKYGLGSCGPPGFYGTLGKFTPFSKNPS
jgi:hypothetical protein